MTKASIDDQTNSRGGESNSPVTYYAPIAYRVAHEEEGWNLKTVLQRRVGVSRRLLSRLKLTEQGITVNGERRYVNAKVHADDVIEIRMRQETSEDILPQPIPLTILHEDEHLLIVDKPAGMIVHPTHGHYINTLANGVVHYWREQGAMHRFRPIHRLDHYTSGVLAIAKNPYAHQYVAEQLKANTVEKHYVAVVHGVPAEREGLIDAPIDRDPSEPHRRIVTSSGYPAQTYYQVERAFRGGVASLVRLRLLTGRTHQIRVHLQHLGCPIIGDPMYGNDGDLDNIFDRQALHASTLAFIHPGSQQRTAYSAKLPADMLNLIKHLED